MGILNINYTLSEQPPLDHIWIIKWKLILSSTSVVQYFCKILFPVYEMQTESTCTVLLSD